MSDDPTPTDAHHPHAPLPPTDAHHARECGGTVVGGRYKLLECVGEGGMGAVWSAQQTAPVRRLVAVKLIKAGIDSKAVLARFEAERQALAVMDHPNIAKILDGGVTDSGSPFFVMELVRGVPITQFCDERRLTPAQRLELFVPVCEAIQHAHQKGVIHRDIKPSNVLVALQDGRPVPKVIDFGIAKATGATLTDLTLNTGVGGVVGTPQYMSPEQASLTGLDIDTRSDVYSLGVLLYELLAGSPPFKRRDLERAGLLEVLRVVRDEEPPKPSTKLSTADACASLSASRGTEPKALAGLLRSELDWVVMKALEKDRTRRYDTPTSFAADVRRYLSGEAVQAHPPSVAYKLRKSLRKNRGPVAAAALVALALLVGVVGTSVGQLRAERARDAEAGQRVVAEEARAAETDQRREAEAARDAEGRQRRRAEAARDVAEARQAEAVASRRRTLAVLQAATGEDIEKLIGSRQDLGPHERAYLEAVAARWRDFAGGEGDGPDARAAAAEGAFRVAALRQKLGDRAAAAEGYRAAAAAWERLAGEFPAVPSYRSDLAMSRNNLGDLLRQEGDWAGAAAECRRAVEAQERLVADFPAVLGHAADLAGSRNNVGLLLAALGKPAEAEAEFRRAVAACERLAAAGGAAPDARACQATSRYNLAGLLRELGRTAEAEAEFRRAIALRERLAAAAPASPEYRRGLAECGDGLSLVLAGVGRRAEAAAESGRARALYEALAADFPAVPEYRLGLGGNACNAGHAALAAGDAAEAVERYDQAVETLRALTAADPWRDDARQFLRNSYWGRAHAHQYLAKSAEADRDAERAIRLTPPKDAQAFRDGWAKSRLSRRELAPPPRPAK